MTNTRQPQVEKKIYLKPTLTEVRLVAEEAVLGFCKNGDGVVSLCGDQLNCSDAAGS